MKNKLDRPDYRERTVRRAAEACQRVYDHQLPGTSAAIPELPLIRASDWHGAPIPEREWHVENLIPARNVTLLSGPGGSGKSTLAAQLAVTTALGKGTWVGQAVRHGKVLMLSAEDSTDELHRRISQITSMSFGSLENLSELHFIDLSENDATLLMPNASKSLVETPVFHSFEQHIQLIAPSLVLIDTLADTFGGNENDRVQARRYASTMRRPAMQSGAAVVILAHPSLTGMNSGSGLSGSTAWDGSVRSRLYMERVKSGEEEPDPDLRRLSLKKSNYGRLGAEFLLRYKNGLFFPEGDPNADRNTTARAKFLELLDWHIERRIDVGPNQGRNYAPRRFAEHPKAAGFTKTAFRSAMSTLLEYRQISTEEIGPPSKRKTVLRRPLPPGAER